MAKTNSRCQSVDSMQEQEGKLRVVNIGLQSFADAISMQKAKVTQLDWRPPVEQSKEVEDLLDLLL